MDWRLWELENRRILFSHCSGPASYWWIYQKNHLILPKLKKPVKTATSPLKRKNIDETLINQICFNPRLAFKFHSRLIAIIFCAFIAIWTTVAFFVAVLGPGIDYIAQVAVYYWQVYAPAIGVFDIIIRSVSVKMVDNQMDATFQTTKTLFSNHLK